MEPPICNNQPSPTERRQVTPQHLEAAAVMRRHRTAGRPSPGLLLGQLQPRGAPEAFGALEAAGAVAEEGAFGTTTPELRDR